MADRIHLQIVTPAAIVVDDMVRYVRLPLEGGSIGVLRGHAPLLGAVTAGVLKYSRGDEYFYAVVGCGVARVTGDVVTVLVRDAAAAEDADAARRAARQMQNENH